MKREYVSKKFSATSLSLIETADEICNQYMNDNLTLTLRQLYYQFVSKAIIDNNMKSYKRLASIINDARLAGLIDWEAIEDRTRGMEGWSSFDSPEECLAHSRRQFARDLWETQSDYVEVWVEKDALIGVVERACAHRRVNHLSCRGYASQSELYRAARRMINESNGKDCHVIYLGDHDPSGLDMTRDVGDRFDIFGANVNVHRIALNYDQVEQYTPPPNPAKMTDSRVGQYISRFGKESWELDALEPTVLVDLIRNKIDSFVDERAWRKAEKEETQQKADLELIEDNYSEALRFIKDNE